MRTLKSRLGIFHPETQRSLLWCLTLELVEDDGSGTKDGVFEDLIEGLSDPKSIDERLFECLAMKGRLVTLLDALDKAQKAKEVVDGAIAELEKASKMEENSWLREPLSDLETALFKLKQNIGNNGEEVENDSSGVGEKLQ
ncbi:hypothetical protein F5B18DRAFT_83815 [Nemania serpens]|nr:hypothetical protein F5B18DRAFT_83815 [Nemania serpens]